MCLFRKPRDGSTWLTSSSQVKRHPDRFFKTANTLHSLGAKSVLCGWWSNISQQKFRIISDSAVPCALGLSYLAESHLRQDRDPFFDNKNRVTPLTARREQFSKSVAMLNCRSYAASAHVPRITWRWTLETSVAHINSIWNIIVFGVSNSTSSKMFILLRITVVNLS